MTYVQDLTDAWWLNLGFQWNDARGCYSKVGIHFYPVSRMLVLDAGGYNCVELWPDTPRDILSVLRMLRNSND